MSNNLYKNSEVIGNYSDYWLLAIKQMKEHGAIDSQQQRALNRKVKSWWYDKMSELEGGRG
ncbi:hypothetical protein [Paenibacillus alvei]|uniref:Uncharacterized protein n=1 Tax=Paenibacillus alvei TaxID=44250 RepID=A0A383RHD1_PAEAL|nr:hypothetical protein [Paenibacillus alvei]SYX85914.1 conserved protein of unknown function [Paenibacillus alvei]